MDDFEDDVPESLNVKPSMNIGLLNSLFRPQSVEIRAETAHATAIKFLALLQEEFPDEDEFRKLMMTWLRSVKDNDFRKFRRVLRKAHEQKSPENDTKTASNE